jgi:cytochrome c biogenesis protein CcmG/thiol:disulfide interchange protein DsbE
MKRVLLFLPLLVALVLGVLLFSGIGKDPTKLDSALVGKAVPEFALEDLHRPEVQVSQQVFQGEPRLLNVWGTWCPACRDEHADLMWLAEDEGVPIVGLNYKDQRAEAKTWLERLGDPYSTSVYDPEGSLGFDLGVYGAPETFVIDADGTVLYRHVGVVNKQVWEETLRPLLNQAGGQY